MTTTTNNKWFTVNGKAQFLSVEQAEQLKTMGLTVEPATADISKDRTMFEKVLAQTVKTGFNYLVSMNGETDIFSLTNSTSLFTSKADMYALINDQIENGAEVFTEPKIFFIPKVTGAGVMFGMKLVLNTETNKFEWSTCFEIAGLVYPTKKEEVAKLEEETEPEETETPLEDVEETETPKTLEELEAETEAAIEAANAE